MALHTLFYVCTSFFAFLSLLSSLITGAAAQTGVITVNAFGPYLQARKCVRSCIADYGGNRPLGDLVSALSCGSPYYDSCFCRSDLRPTGSAFISKCINSLCASNTVDLNQGLLIWDAYCSRTTAPFSKTALISLDKDAGYLQARPCARSCIQDYGGNRPLGDLVNANNCGNALL